MAENVYQYVLDSVKEGLVDKETAKEMLRLMKTEEDKTRINIKKQDDIAIIGISVHLPYADHIDEFWKNIEAGIDCISEISDVRKEDIKNYLKASKEFDEDTELCHAAYLNRIDQFDHKLFRISPRDAKLMDPNQRMFLQTAWEAIEDAGYGSDKLSATDTGIYLGFADNMKDSYQKMIYETGQEYVSESIALNMSALTPSRIAYMLNLKGPSIVIDTACSSSLVAVHLACQGIESGDCDAALAGGIKLNILPVDDEQVKFGIESTDGRTRTFDEASNGAGVGEGCVAILLKRLSKAVEDHDNIYAVIKGSAVNQDGSSMGITAPNPTAQTEVIKKAWSKAGVTGEMLDYIEVHGTGTKLGDPIEIQGLEKAFEQDTKRKQFCCVSSVKTNIGHLYEASGITSLVKAVLALRNKKIPSSILFELPNQKIDFSSSPLYVNTKPRYWKKKEHGRICGVSSFGLSGTNCHVVLSEYEPQRAVSQEDMPNIFTISTKTEHSLIQYIKNYRTFLEGSPDIRFSDLCNTVNKGRNDFSYRLAVKADSLDDLQKKLNEIDLNHVMENDLKHVYIKEHKVVSDKSVTSAGKDLTKREKSLLTNRISEIIEKARQDGAIQEKLDEICSLYVQGADVNWEMLYQEDYKKISAPAYPFEKNRFWIDIDTEKLQQPENGQLNTFYKMTWVPDELEQDITLKNSNVLVIHSAGKIAEETIQYLKEMDVHVFSAQFGNEFVKLDQDHYRISTSKEDIEALFSELKEINIHYIVCIPESRSADTIDEMTAIQSLHKMGVYHLFYLTKELVKMDTKNVFRILLVSDYVNQVTGHEEYLKPEHAALFGLGKVVGKEYQNIQCYAVDIDKFVTAKQIVNELGSDSKQFLRSYRDGVRYTEEFSSVHLNEYPVNDLEIKENGTYVIAGGLGGIGLEIAKYLASKANVNIITINRSSMPARSQWDRILDEDEHTKICSRIRAIQEIEAYGSKVSMYHAHLEDESAVSNILKDVIEKHTNINGVIHSAGVAKDGFIYAKEVDTFNDVFMPKVYGTWILDKLTRACSLDFFIMFSSGVSLAGEPGQGDYIAANSFLDSYAAYRQKKGCKTITINWPAWEETGMAKEFGLNVDTLFKTIKTKDAISGFDKVIHRNISNILIGKPNVKSELLAFTLKHSIFRISDEVRAMVDHCLQADKTAAVPEKKALPEVTLTGRSNHQYSENEVIIANILSYVIGTKEVDINDSFFELGVDSVSMMKIVSEIRTAFGVEVNFNVFVEGITVEKLAVLVGESAKEEIAAAAGSAEEAGTGDRNTESSDYYEAFDLTEVQRAYLLGRSSQFEIGGVGTHYYVEIETEYDIKRFEKAFQKVIDRHPMLRAVITPEGKQKFLKDVPDYNIDMQDLSMLSQEKIQEKILEERKRLSHYVFQAGIWPMFHIKAFKLAEKKHYLFIGYDLLISDSLSIEQIGKEVYKYYHNPSMKPAKLNYTFKDYICDYKKIKDSNEYKLDKAYWMSRLDDYPGAPSLPVTVDPAAVEEPHFQRMSYVIKEKEWESLKTLAGSNHVTPSVMICTMYAMVLCYWTGDHRFALNLAAFNRYPFDEKVDELVGDFTTVMLLEIDLQANTSFWDKARSIQKKLFEVMQHRSYDGVEFIRELALRNRSMYRALMPVVFTSVLYDDAQGSWNQFGDMKMGISQTSQVYLDCQAMAQDGGVVLNWDYVSEIFDENVITEMFGKYTDLIEQLAAGDENPQIKLDAYSLEQLEAYNSTEKELAYDTLHEMFRKAAEEHPDKEAVVFGEERVTYKELDMRSNQVANWLAARGVSKGSFIGIVGERRPGTVAVMLGILKAGAAYVPVDPEYPQDRTDYILENSGADMLLTLDLYEKEIKDCPRGPVQAGAELSDAAYVIYTSGSTGKPKGVVITHEGAANTIADINERFRIGEADRVIGISSMCFDLSVYDIFGALACGACLVMVEDQRDMEDLARVVEKEQITVWNSVPAIMGLLAENVEEAYRNSSLRTVLLSGDWIPLALPEKIKQKFPNSSVISLGGATEGSVWSIWYPVSEVEKEWTSIPYGRPLSNQTFYVMDYDGNPCPLNVPGELYIGGRGVAAEYKNDREKTEYSFVHREPYGRLYRTGDYGVLRDSAEGCYIEFLGRKDSQVKISGYRVELGEIEARLLEMEQVKNAAAAVFQENGGRYICGYVEGREEISEEEVKERLRTGLPEYMVPKYIVKLDKIPLSGNGKVDRKALPQPEARRDAGGYAAPGDEIEARMAEMVQNALKVEKVGIRDNFFDLGIDSVIMVQMVNEMNCEFHVRIRFKEFAGRKNIEELARMVRAEQGSGERTGRAEEIYRRSEPDPEHRHDPFPLTEVQMAYLVGRESVMEMGGVSAHGYTEIETRLDMQQLNRALGKVIARHPMMRTVFLEDGSQAVLKEIPQYEIAVEDISMMDEAGQRERIREERDRMSHYVFNPAQWPLFEMKSLKTAEGTHCLMVGYDLLIADGASTQIVSSELAEYYMDPDAELPEMEHTFRDYMTAYRNFKDTSAVYLEDREYWLGRLDGFPAAPALPMKRKAERDAAPHFSRLSKVMPEERWKSIQGMAQRYHVTPSALLCSVYAEVIGRFCNQDRFALNLTVFNRYPFFDGVDRIVGDFTSVILLDVDMKSGNTFKGRAGALQQVLMESLEHRHYEGVEFIRDIAKHRQLGSSAVMPVVFTSMIFNSIESSSSLLGTVTCGVSQTPQVYLDHQASDFDGNLTLVWDYADNYVDGRIIEKMFEAYTEVLERFADGIEDARIGLDAEDREKLEAYNSTEKELSYGTLHEMFRKAAEEHPDKEAVVFGEERVTYKELDMRSNQVANWLAARGVSKGSFIGIVGERRPGTVAVMLGILKAGAAYVPVDPEYPRDRTDYILENSGADMLLTLDLYEKEIRNCSQDPVHTEVKLSDAAYVIYTSGSTGKPKGVVITHEGAANTIADINERFRIGEADRVIGISSMCFDLSVYDIFGTLACGACLVMVEDQRDMEDLARVVEKEQITVWNSVPAIMSLVAGLKENKEDISWSDETMIEVQDQDRNRKVYDKKYYWSPLVNWRRRNETYIINDIVCPPVISEVFLDFYELMQKGATVEQVIRNISNVDEYELRKFIRELLEEKVLRDSLLKPQELYGLQDNYFDNPYGEEIIYVEDANKKFKLEKLNRILSYDHDEKIKCPVEIEYPGWIEKRKTHRQFDEKNIISKELLFKLLSVYRQRRTGDEISYYYSSAGGLYPIDIYIYVKEGRVSGFEEGIYYYCPIDNSLILVNKVNLDMKKAHYYTNVKIGRSSAFSIYYIYNAGVSMPKYGGMGHYYAGIDTGIMVQTLTTAAELLHVGTCSIGDMNFNEIEKYFKLSNEQLWVHTLEVGLKLNGEKSIVDDAGSLIIERQIAATPEKPQLEHIEKNKTFIENKKAEDAAAKKCFQGSSLRVVMLSGDWIPMDLPEKIAKYAPNADVISLGGATEASIWSIYYPIDQVKKEWRSIPYGMPLSNQQFYILGYDMQPCMPGIPGELYIGGIGVAKEYCNDKAKTEAAFIHHPQYGVIYKTGDYGLYHEEGYIEFLGRKDDQIKIKGHRIELGEIQNVLAQYDELNNAVAVDITDEDNNRFLCAFYTAQAEVDHNVLRDYLRDKLPYYMIPAVFRKVDFIPLTSNGKVNRKSLPKVSLKDTDENAFVEPVSDIEKKLAYIWEVLLANKRIGIHDNFFEMGGDSVLLIKAHAEVQKLTNKNIRIVDMFNNPTIAKLAAFILEEESVLSVVKVNGTKLPDEFFAYEDDSEETLFTVEVTEHIGQSLKQLQQNYKINPNSVFASSFAYTLAQYSGEEEIELNMSCRHDSFSSFSINFAQMDNFVEAVRIVEEKADKTSDYSLKKTHIKQESEDQTIIVSLFYDKERNKDADSLTEKFDIVMGSYISNGNYTLEYQYKQNQFSLLKMEEFIETYSRVLEIVIENMNSGLEETAAD